ncbi:MAG TPA: biotin/lipoyl-containing protein [Candidatus Limnocylindria bacterium]|nr:biotin/lipoyl-containing protein [Candidatus Limnocylindria bacterium]
MSDPDSDLRQVELAAREIVPKLAARLGSHGLGELEVRHGELRVRVAGAPAKPEADRAAAGAAAGGGQPHRGVEQRPAAGTNHGVTSPAVGYFGFAEKLGPGLGVDKGDVLGHVDMLGVRHEVRAPRRGTVRHLVAEAGEPVEYGQVVIELEPAE